MDLFKLVGKIVVQNSEANKALSETSSKAKETAADVNDLVDAGEKSGSKLKSAFEQIGSAFKKMFDGDNTKKVEKSFDSLTTTTQKQKDKLQDLKTEYKNMYIQHGKNSDEAKKVANEIKQLSKEIDKNEKELGEASAAADKYDKSLSDVGDSANNAKSKFSSAMGKVGSAAVKVGGAIVTGIGAASVAVAGLVKSSVTSYAEYEQLVGGVETLFKGSAQKVQAYAANAYKTAGLSANEYMETVTSFSASLLQSLGGDTEKAAEKADMAITDMSDNANKMGTDISMIQNAYQGFAKQNYTMLDNLKLGYGGTKEEMERLLADAQAISGVEYDISSYADVVDAIHVIQSEMGITGTTAKEASSTISGSIASMKSSWQNLLTAMADDSLPFDEYVNNFADSVATVTENLLPRISVALDGVVGLIDKLAPIIINKIPELLSSLLPSVISAATGLIQSIISILPGLVDMLTNDLIPQLLQGIVAVFESLVSALPTLVESLMSALVTLLPMVIDAVISMVVSLCSNFSSILQPIIDALPDLIIAVVDAIVRNLPLLIQGVITLVMGIVTAIPQIIESLVGAIPTIVEMLLTSILQNLPLIIAGLIKVVFGIVKALPQIFASLIEGIGNIFIGIWEAIKNVFAPAGDWFGEMFGVAKDNIMQAWSDVKDRFADIWDGIKKVFSNIGKWFSDKFKDAKNKVMQAWSDVKAKFSSIWNGIKNVFSNIGKWFSDKFKDAKNKVMQAWSDVKAKFAGIWNGIKGAFANVGSWFKNIFTSAKNGVVNAWSSVKAKFNSIKNGIVEAFSNIKEKLTAPFEKARDLIEKIAGKIKGFFKGEISMPKIKLPHFSIKPKGWKIGDLLDGVKPTLGIEWYAKAVNNPMIMNSPTVFGYNAETNNLRVGGETESEVISGTNTLMDMIGATVESKTAAPLDRIVSLLVALLEATANGNNDLLKAILAGQTIVLNNREVARTVREYA